MASCLIKLTMCLNNRWILGQRFFSSAKFPGTFFISDEDFNQNTATMWSQIHLLLKDFGVKECSLHESNPSARCCGHLPQRHSPRVVLLNCTLSAESWLRVHLAWVPHVLCSLHHTSSSAWPALFGAPVYRPALIWLPGGDKSWGQFWTHMLTVPCVEGRNLQGTRKLWIATYSCWLYELHFVTFFK